MTLPENTSGLIRLECPNCRSPLNQMNATSQAIVCPKCSSYVSIGSEVATVLGKGRKLPPSPVPLQLGDKGTVAGAEYVVLGRVLYRGRDDEETFTWNEWLMGASDGRMLWLSLDENGFALFQKMRFRAQFDPRISTALDLGEKKAFIHERYPAEVVGAEGELTWRAMPGEKVFMAEGASGGLKYSIQQTPQELEVHEGRTVTALSLAQAFKKEAWLKQIASEGDKRGTFMTIAALCITAAIAGVVLAVFASMTGTADNPRTIELSSSSPEAGISVEFNEARPAIIGIELISGGLPDNSFIDIDVEMISPDGTEDLLFEQELWHESGYDDEGAWRETQYSTSEMFVPSQAGSHQLNLSYDGSVLSSLTLQVTVRHNHIMPLWFLIYAGFVGLLGLIAFFVGNSARQY